MDVCLKETLDIYKKAGHDLRWYAYIQWLIFPFGVIDDYVSKDGRILNIGCGYGVLDNYLLLKSKKRTLVGVDFSERRIRVATASKGNRQGIDFYCSDIWNFPMRDYTEIIMTNFLHHINYDEQERLIKKCFLSLQKGGRLIIKELGDKPKWKCFLSYTIAEKTLYPFDKIYYNKVLDLKRRLCNLGFKTEIIPMHKKSPFSHYLFISEKPL